MRAFNAATIFAAEAPNGNFLPGDINEFYWGSAAFLVVVAFLLWKVRPSIVKMFKKSNEQTKNEVEWAQNAADDAQCEFSEFKSKLGDISSEREQILTEARESAQNLEEELKQKAHQDAEEVKTRFSHDTELSRVQAQNEVKQQLARVALTAAENIVADSLDEKTHDQLLDDYISSNLKKANN